MTEPIVSYFDVTLFEDGREILNKIILEIYPGDMLYITGTVGSGKSTLLKSIYGEKKIHSGDARVAGFDMNRLSRKDIPFLRRKLGPVFQNYQLLNDRDTRRNIQFAMECTGEKNKKLIKQRTLELSEEAGIEHLLHKMPYELSGGEQQLVSIVRALMNEPELIIADEPTANLDRESSRRIMQFLQRLSEDGTAVIIATHDDTLIAEFPSETLRIENKRLEKFTAVL
jgi:cell division transport system ATP-binding protein